MPTRWKSDSKKTSTSDDGGIPLKEEDRKRGMKVERKRSRAWMRRWGQTKWMHCPPASRGDLSARHTRASGAWCMPQFFLPLDVFSPPSEGSACFRAFSSPLFFRFWLFVRLLRPSGFGRARNHVSHHLRLNVAENYKSHSSITELLTANTPRNCGNKRPPAQKTHDL